MVQQGCVSLPGGRVRCPKALTVSAEKNEGGTGDWVRVLREAGPYLSIGTSRAATVLLGLGVGYWIDRRFGTQPVFFMIGSVAGVLTALYQFFKTVNRKP